MDRLPAVAAFAVVLLLGSAPVAAAPSDWPAGLLEARPETPEGTARAVASDWVGVAPLDPIRWPALRETIDDAGVDEAFWVVVEDAALTRDALLRFERDGGSLRVTHTAWAPRDPRNAEDPRGVYRERTGRTAPKKGSKQVIVQGFVRRERTAYRHAPLPPAERSGLLALLDETDVLRTTRRVPGIDPPRTLAIVYRDAYLEPSSCARPADVHHDRARAFAVLADAGGVRSRIPLEPESAGPRRFRRTACRDGDAAAFTEDPDGFARRLAGRTRVPIVEWTDDGHAVVRAADAAWRIDVAGTELGLERIE